MRPSTTVKTSIIMVGWMTAQAMPKNVCLYRILMSRNVKKYSSSRYRQISANFSSNRRVGGVSTFGRSADKWVLDESVLAEADAG